MTKLLLAIIFSSAILTSPTFAAAPPSAETAQKTLANSPRHGEWVDVPLGDVKIHTWVVYPERKDKAPAVLVIHEIFGMSDWVRSITDALAAEGFIAVAPALLSGMGPNGGGTESFSADGVRDAIRKLKSDEVARRLNAVRNYVLAQPSAKDKTASIGFCWGGGMSFSYATTQPKLNAAVVYYGTPPTAEDMQKIPCPVIGFYGADDNRVTSTVKPTELSMSKLNKSYRPTTYEDAGHGFLRQQSAREANRKAAEQAWPATIAF